MSKEKYTVFDAADFLQTDAEIATFLTEAAGDGAEALARALGVAARARKLNMTATAQRANVTRQGLHKALGDKGNPSLALALDVLTSLGMTVAVQPAGEGIRVYGEKLLAAKAARDKIAHGVTPSRTGIARDSATGRLAGKTPRRARNTAEKAR